MPGLDAYLMKDANGLFTPDVEKLKKLSIETFAMIHDEEMDLFMRSHGENITCYSCSSPIETPTNLIRYFGQNLHNPCFLREYENDRFDLTIRDKEYYGLVKKAKRPH